MYRKLIKPLLFSLTIERAHRVALLLLRGIGLIPGGLWLLRKCYAVKHPALEREVFGIRFPNPVGLAAGFDRNGEALRPLSALGFGFVEIGTVTPRPQAGNPRPRVFRLPKDRAIVNRIGIANRGLDATVRHLRRGHEGILVGCNIGKNTDTPPENAPADYLRLFRNLYQYADYFTVNISCDNACHDEKDLHARASAEHSRPAVRLPPRPERIPPRDAQDFARPLDEEIDRVTDVLMSTPLDGIVASNGSHGSRQGLRTSRTSLDKIGSGRLSGAPLTRRAAEIVRRIRTRSGGTYPIIGAGGLMSPDDVRAMLDAGADLVQIYTGYVYEGPGFAGDICRALIADAERAAQAQAAVPVPNTASDAPAGPNSSAGPDTPSGTDAAAGMTTEQQARLPQEPATKA